jgi:hypothetical protein
VLDRDQGVNPGEEHSVKVQVMCSCTYTYYAQFVVMCSSVCGCRIAHPER